MNKKWRFNMDKKLPNIHPGEILIEEFLEPMKITSYRLAKETRIDQTRVSEIINGKRSITVDTALRFSKFFGTSPEFWLNLQIHYDMEEKMKNIEKELELIIPMKIAN
jgi:addiction module HigA family antidote